MAAINLTGSEHTVQFFETRPALCGAVCRFACDALSAGDDALLIVVPEHRSQILDGLSARGLDVKEALSNGQLVLQDAQETLDGFMVRGVPDAERFIERVSGLLERRSGPGRGLKVYGEMVSVLWGTSQRHAALELESLWNILATAHPISLLCGYLVDDMQRFGATQEFLEICDLHSHPLLTHERQALA